MSVFHSMPRTESPICERISFANKSDIPSLFEVYGDSPDVVLQQETTTEADGRNVFHIIAYHITGRFIVVQADDNGLQSPYRMNLPYAHRHQQALFDHWWHYETMSRTRKGMDKLRTITNERLN